VTERLFVQQVTIGPHRLFLADAYRLRPTLGFHDADVMDPPYLIRASGAGRYRKKRPMMDKLIAEGLHKGFDLTIISPLHCGSVVVFAHTDQLAPVLTRLASNWHRHALCVWEKVNPQPVANKHYRPDLEFYAHAWQPGFHPQGSMAELLRITKCGSPRMSQKHGHPTTKPAVLMDKIVANVAGTTVCDAFMGTGSTGVAAVRAGRIFTGIEHNPEHFETAVRRITEAHHISQRKAAA
jgi:hypothetical protein